MTTSKRLAPLLACVAALQRRAIDALWQLGDRLAAMRRARAPGSRASGLPSLLAELGRRFTPLARRHGVILALDVDACLDPDLDIPVDDLRAILAGLLLRAIRDTQATYVALHVDVVGGNDRQQHVHLSVVDSTTAPGDNPRPQPPVQALQPVLGRLTVDALAAIATRIGGILLTDVEAGQTRLVLDVTFPVVRPDVAIDVESLREALGGDDALRDVASLLDRTLSADLARLEAVLAQDDDIELENWLHRVSGALGMAEASDLAWTGVELERAVSQGRRPAIDDAVRRFARRVEATLDALRACLGADAGGGDLPL